MQYKTYIADVLRLTGENIAGLVHGNYVKTTWSEIMSPEVQDTRTGDEIAYEAIKRAGLKVEGGE